MHISKESSRSSSAARYNVLYYTIWYSRYNRACRRVLLQLATARLQLIIKSTPSYICWLAMAIKPGINYKSFYGHYFCLTLLSKGTYLSKT